MNNNLTKEQLEALAIQQIIQEEFTNSELSILLLSSLQAIFNDDNVAVVKFLNSRKESFEKIREMNKN